MRFLKGTSGDDILDYADAVQRGSTGGRQTYMTGNGGNDTFVFDSNPNGNGNATITDFSSGDLIDLSAVDGLTLGDISVSQVWGGWKVVVDAPNEGLINLTILGQGFDFGDFILPA